MKKRFNKVHAMCQRMRDGINLRRETLCKLCPAWEQTPGHGKTQRMCYSIAKETMNIAVHGNPWGRNAKHAKSWRKRWQRD